MDVNEFLQSLSQSLGGFLPQLLGALGILVLGWFVALGLRAATRKLLGAAQLNRRVAVASGEDAGIDLESGAARVVFYVVMLMAVLAFLNALKLDMVSGPLQGLATTVLDYVPRLLAAGVILLVAWVLARLLRMGATQALARTSLDEKMSAEAGMSPISQSLANVLYWLVFLLFLPAVLGALEMQGLLSPVQDVVDEMLAMLPNVFAASIIGLVGWFIARIVRDLTINLLAAAGADRLGQKAGLAGNLTLSRLSGLVVYILVLVPSVIAALNALQIEAIAGPATEMLSTLLAALPNIFAAGLILATTWFVARLVSQLLTSLLAGGGFDRIPAALGLDGAFAGDWALSQLVGRLVVFFAMLFATVEAADRLGFEQVSSLVTVLLAFGGQVLLGTVIIAAGFWLAGLAHNAVIRVHGAQGAGIATVARFAILGLVLAMGLRAMGVADDIVRMAFGLTLGAAAVAFSLSFGLGGRQAAGELMGDWVARVRQNRAKRASS